jgi:hypothetical protein
MIEIGDINLQNKLHNNHNFCLILMPTIFISSISGMVSSDLFISVQCCLVIITKCMQWLYFCVRTMITLKIMVHLMITVIHSMLNTPTYLLLHIYKLVENRLYASIAKAMRWTPVFCHAII